MAGMVPLPITAIDLVKAADAAVKAADEPSRGVDALNYLAKQEVTASILLATGAGKKVFSPRCIHDCCSLQRRVFLQIQHCFTIGHHRAIPNPFDCSKAHAGTGHKA